MALFKKAARLLRYIIPTLYVNFHYLPLAQAVRLPIVLYRPHLIKCKGKIVIDTDEPIRTGMIQLGNYCVSIYPNNGITLDIRGTIIFKGACVISNDSYLSVGETGTVTIGKRFEANVLKMCCYQSITFQEDVSFGWECLVMDTDFHRLTNTKGSVEHEVSGRILIESGCWIAARCMIMKNTYLPSKCVVAARSFLNKHYDIAPCTMLAGQPAKVVKEGVFRNISQERQGQ